MKIVIIGGVAGGAGAAARLRRLNEQAEIVLLERGPYISFSNCCLPYFLGGIVADSEDLLMMTPTSFQKRFAVDARINSEVISVDREAHSLTVYDRVTGAVTTEFFDKLILATGAAAIRPRSIRGVDASHVFTVKTIDDVKALHNYLSNKSTKRVAVVGGGFIGLETAENLSLAGCDVTLIEGTDQVMPPLDFDMAQTLHRELHNHGIRLLLNTTVTEIETNTVHCVCGENAIRVASDAVVLSVGVVPETELAEKAGLRIGETKGVWVQAGGQTDDPDIYAVGDVTEGLDLLQNKPGRLALAGLAQRQARDVADAVMGNPVSQHGFIRSSCLKLFDLNIACTGMNEKTALKAGIEFDFAYILPPDKVGIMPGSHYMAFKLLFELQTGHILGAQAIGKGDVVRRIDVIASMITMNGTLMDLKDLELCYSPTFGTARDVVNLAALVGINIRSGAMPQVRVSDARNLVESGAYIIDVREPREYEAGHLKGAVNIPLGSIRERMNDIPRDIPVYLHCRTSQRSYYALCILRGNGYRNVKNISGSFLGICLYEYFRDISEQREPIVTAYNFK